MLSAVSPKRRRRTPLLDFTKSKTQRHGVGYCPDSIGRDVSKTLRDSSQIFQRSATKRTIGRFLDIDNIRSTTNGRQRFLGVSDGH
jgi:hypothetical protein